MAVYRVTFKPLGKTVEVDSADFPLGDHGRPGSILDVALDNGIHIEHACGGVGACATCHVLIEDGAGNVSEPTEEELDQVELAPNFCAKSRLACLATIHGDVTVRIPDWNRNAVSEGD